MDKAVFEGACSLGKTTITLEMVKDDEGYKTLSTLEVSGKKVVHQSGRTYQREAAARKNFALCIDYQASAKGVVRVQ